MKTVVSNLYELQKIELLTTGDSSGTKLGANRLRDKIPADILDVYERYRMRGRKAVAVVRNGVCGECHLRIPMGTLVDLMHGEEMMRCGNCGRYLYLPADAPVASSVSSSARPASATAQASPVHATRGRRKKVELTAQAA